ncbi:MAG: hypothetical protein KGM24_00030 [Elusimicrobia bacterium]|nr:hypothetical protein [Elusimicrobiota bacterium]
MRRSLAGALALALAAGPAAAADRAVGDLLDANAAAHGAAGLGAVFDGSRAAGGDAIVVVPRSSAARAGAVAALAKSSATAAAATAAAPVVSPTPASGISDGWLGPYREGDFVLGTGRCPSCRGPLEGKWYFLDDVIATPKSGPPAIVWIGSHRLFEHATLLADGLHVRLADGTVMPFQLVPRLATNQSWYDASSLAYLRGRTLRIRGEIAEIGGVPTLVARTLWPEDFRLDPARLRESMADATSRGIDGLVAADDGGAKKPFQQELLWERPGEGRDWDGRPVMGFMLNGAQGDDDEAKAGHFSMFTGRVGPHGSMADWMFDNFYDMDTVSEKGIISAMVPMDKYMTDLNAGQSWYRPTDMLVFVMKDDSLTLKIQELFKQRYAQYYAHTIRYDHTKNPCTALIVDPLAQEGWHYPKDGPTPKIVARLFASFVSRIGGGPKAGAEVYGLLRQEPTHLFPRAAFDSLGGDVLSLEGAYGAEPLGRELDPFEKALRDGLLAVVWVRIPQIPSSRAYGADPAGGVLDYFRRVPLDRSKWRTVPTPPRPFPPPH